MVVMCCWVYRHFLQHFKYWPQVVAMSCLFLAGKVEETPKKSRDILKQAKALLSDHQFSKFGSNVPRVRNVKAYQLVYKEFVVINFRKSCSLMREFIYYKPLYLIFKWIIPIHIFSNLLTTLRFYRYVCTLLFMTVYNRSWSLAILWAKLAICKNNWHFSC